MNQNSLSTKKFTNPKTGELLVREGFITENDLNKALLIQKEEAKEADMPFDVLLGRKGFLNASQLEILNEHPDLKKKIWQIAVDHEIINKKQVK